MTRFSDFLLLFGLGLAPTLMAAPPMTGQIALHLGIQEGLAGSAWSLAAGAIGDATAPLFGYKRAASETELWEQKMITQKKLQAAHVVVGDDAKKYAQSDRDAWIALKYGVVPAVESAPPSKADAPTIPTIPTITTPSPAGLPDGVSDN